MWCCVASFWRWCVLVGWGSLRWRVWQVLGLFCGSPFGPSSNAFCMLLHLRFFHIVAVGVAAPLQLASMTSMTDVRDCSEIASIVWNAASESVAHVNTIRVVGLVTVQLFRQWLPNLRIRQQAAQGTELPPRQLISLEFFQLAIMWASGGKL